MNVHLTFTTCRLLGITHGLTRISRSHLCASILSNNHRFDTLFILYAREIYFKAIFLFNMCSTRYLKNETLMIKIERCHTSLNRQIFIDVHCCTILELDAYQ